MDLSLGSSRLWKLQFLVQFSDAQGLKRAVWWADSRGISRAMKKELDWWKALLNGWWCVYSCFFSGSDCSGLLSFFFSPLTVASNLISYSLSPPFSAALHTIKLPNARRSPLVSPCPSESTFDQLKLSSSLVTTDLTYPSIRFTSQASSPLLLFDFYAPVVAQSISTNQECCLLNWP